MKIGLLRQVDFNSEVISHVEKSPRGEMSVLCGVSGCSKSVAITKSLMGVKSSQRPFINAIASVPRFIYWLGNSTLRERTSRWCFLQRQPLSTLSRHIAFKFIVRIRCHKPLERRVTRIRVHSAMHEAHAHTAKFGLSNGKQCKEGGSRRRRRPGPNSEVSFGFFSAALPAEERS